MDKTFDNKRLVGALGEEAAAEYLKKKGHAILERNFRYSRLGEIDIISREKSGICFIEVKTRSSTRYGYPREAVNNKKQNNIRRLAQIYLSKNKIKDTDVRFDVVEVYIKKYDNKLEVSKIFLIENAF